MSTRPIGEIIRPLLIQAVGLARLHEFLSCFPPKERLKWIHSFVEGGTLTAAEADLLIEQDRLEAA